MRYYWIAAGMLATFVGGCTPNLVGERTNFTREMALKQVPVGWQQSETGGAKTLSSLQDLSKNKQLLAHVGNVLSNNISLRQSVLNLKRTRLSAQKEKKALLPTIDLSATNERQTSGSSSAINNTYTGTASVNWEVDLWGKLSDRAFASQQRVSASSYELKALQTSLTAQAMRNWITLTATKELASLDQSRIRSFKRTEEIISEQFSRGIGQISDLEAARTSTRSAQASLANRQLQADVLARKMLIMADQPLTSKLSSGGKIPNIVLPAGVVPATVLGRRPDLLAAFEKAGAADTAYQASYKELLPSFNISLSASQSTPNFSDLLSGGPAWRLLGSLSAPILDGGTRKLAAQQADLEAAGLWLSYRNLLMTAMMEVENGLQSESTLRKREFLLTKAFGHAQSNYQQYQNRYQDGLIDIVTLLSAEREAFAAQQALISVRNDRMINRVNLAVALGVGL